jgi:hypothetical protein
LNRVKHEKRSEICALIARFVPKMRKWEGPKIWGKNFDMGFRKKT